MDKGNPGLPPIDRVRLHGRVAVVTGASQGIGFACARRLAANGCSVVLVGRTAHTLRDAERLLSSEGYQAKSIACDVCDLDAFASLMNGLDRLNILVNNAGGNRPAPFLDVTRDDFDRLVDLNVRSAFFGSQAALRRMIQLGARGSIINMSSQMGHVGSAETDRLLPHQTRRRRFNQSAGAGSRSFWHPGKCGGSHVRADSDDGEFILQMPNLPNLFNRTFRLADAPLLRMWRTQSLFWPQTPQPQLPAVVYEWTAAGLRNDLFFDMLKKLPNTTTWRETL